MMLYRRLDRKCITVDKIPDHVEKFMETADELASVGTEISDKVLVYMLLNVLPSSFEYFEVAMTTRERIPTLSELKLKIKDELARQNQASPSEATEAEENTAWLARKPGNWKGSQWQQKEGLPQ